MNKSILNNINFYCKSMINCIGKRVSNINNIESININNIDGYIIQGITNVKDTILVSAYNEDKSKKSIIIVINDNKVDKIIELDNNAHVGGIAYDNKNNILWVTGKKGCINGYNFNDLLNNNNIPIYKNIYVGNNLYNIYGNISCAYICINNNKLYVGNYNTNKYSIINIYNINNDGSIDTNIIDTIKCFDTIQGITFYKDKILFSSSSGRYASSKLYICDYKEDIYDYRKLKCNIIKMPPMMEQINIYNDRLMCAFESNANKYKLRNRTSNDIEILDVTKYL